MVGCQERCSPFQKLAEEMGNLGKLCFQFDVYEHSEF